MSCSSTKYHYDSSIYSLDILKVSASGLYYFYKGNLIERLKIGDNIIRPQDLKNAFLIIRIPISGAPRVDFADNSDPTNIHRVPMNMSDTSPFDLIQNNVPNAMALCSERAIQRSNNPMEVIREFLSGSTSSSSSSSSGVASWLPWVLLVVISLVIIATLVIVYMSFVGKGNKPKAYRSPPRHYHGL